VPDAHAALFAFEPLTRYGNLNASSAATDGGVCVHQHHHLQPAAPSIYERTLPSQILRRVHEVMADATLRRRLVIYQTGTGRGPPGTCDGFGCRHCMHVEARHHKKGAGKFASRFGLDDECELCDDL